MSEIKKLPIGIESFQEIRTNNFYYVDKTKLIEQLLERWGKVNLFTRPRRFGKTLNMSMLKCFFEYDSDSNLFNGLDISKNERIMKEYQGKYPVIFISLKGIEGQTYLNAKYRLTELIANEAERFSFLANSDKLSNNDKKKYLALTTIVDGKYFIDEEILTSSLKLMSQLLYKHYNQKVIILIDEYDVPLDKAFKNGYYKEMVSLIRILFGEALKTNEYLHFAVLTGCLRISKESIFTGLNNFKVLSITDSRFDEQFGFTEAEVNSLLKYYKLENHSSEIKTWYDGYHFGNANVYCPWDVINHVDLLCDDPNGQAQSYWINTSSNDLVRRFFNKADRNTRDEIERLIIGEVIEKEILQELTYDEIDNSIDNLYSVLLTTGYLTYSQHNGSFFKLKIPNEEVRAVFKFQIKKWFEDTIQKDSEKLKSFWFDIAHASNDKVENYLNFILSNSISVFDSKGRKGEKELSYHMILTALLATNENWAVKSNVEAGNGFADIIIKLDDSNSGVIFELKHCDSYDKMEEACLNAIKQIIDRNYASYLRNDGRNDILIYGIAFCKKRCKVISKLLINLDHQNI